MLTAVVLGGNADQVPLVEALNRRGYRTVLIDYLPEPPAKAIAHVHHQVSTRDVGLVSGVVELERPAFVTSIGNDLVVPVIAEVSERFGLPCPQSYADARRSTNKRLMKMAFRQAGIPTSEEFDLTPSREVDSDALPFPLIAKLLVGYGARGVRRINDKSELGAYIKEHEGQELLVEAFLEGGVEISVDCFAHDGAAQVLMVSRLHQVPGLRQVFSVLMAEFPYEVERGHVEELEGIAQRMSAAFGISNGPFFFQAMLQASRISVIEMGARIAGGRKFAAVRDATGFNLLEAQIDVLEGKPVHIDTKPSDRYWISAMLFAKAGTVATIEPPPAYSAKQFFLVKRPGFDSSGTGTGDDRLAVLTVDGHGSADARGRLHEALRQVRVNDAAGRSMLRLDLYP